MMDSPERQTVQKALNDLKPYLEAYVEQRVPYGPIQRRYKRAPNRRDTQALLRTMLDKWYLVFAKELQPVVRSYVHELIDVRNRWAHEEPFSQDEAERAADTARMLAKAIGVNTAKQTKKAKEIRRGRGENEMMVKRLPDGEITERTWNFRDDINQNFYGMIPEDQKVITLTLNWKPDAVSNAALVGKYQIDIEALLGAGYVERRTRGTRLRFQRTGETIEIAINRNSKALPVGERPTISG